MIIIDHKKYQHLKKIAKNGQKLQKTVKTCQKLQKMSKMAIFPKVMILGIISLDVGRY